MEITIVEPCPECGQPPRKITAELDGFDQWMSFRCSCGFSQSYKVSDFYEGLRKWNEEAFIYVSRRRQNPVHSAETKS